MSYLRRKTAEVAGLSRMKQIFARARGREASGTREKHRFTYILMQLFSPAGYLPRCPPRFAPSRRTRFDWQDETTPPTDSSFRALYDFCMTFESLMERNARDGKSTKTQRFKTGDTVKPLIYLNKTHFSIAKKEWW